jgi:putative transposase
MPRKARIVLANCPHHIVQRGHNRAVVFAEDRDYLYYLDNLSEWKSRLGCRLYSYCLMTNHIHLVVDPGDDPASLGLLMKRVTGRQTRLVNTLERRSGSLWEGRYKSSPIETDRYLLACCQYVELNPVRARMVASPEQYRWSSYRAKIGEVEDDWLDKDPCYLALGDTDMDRQRRYRIWVSTGIHDTELRLIRQAVQRGQLTGGDRFISDIEAKIGRRVGAAGRGRPPKNKSVPF